MDLATGAIGSVISKLVELLKGEYKLQTGVKEQVQSLALELRSAHVFLQEIDTVPPDQLDNQVKNWACEVRDASYDMEDILDTFIVRVKGPKPIKESKFKRLKEKMGSLLSKTKARHDIANMIEEVNKKVKEISDRRKRYKLDGRVVSPATPSSFVDPRIARVHGISASLLIGINERKDAVIKMLSHDDNDNMSSKKRKVVSLVGSGGLGKTTLAKATYDQLKQRYECGASVSVGQKPDLVNVFKNILFYLDERKFGEIHSTQKGADVLIPELIEFLRDKRYLIVIDDVWETQCRDKIMEALVENNIGSRIIITTRKSEVAIGEVYKVQPLSVDNSKALFYTRIFGGEDGCPDNQQQKVSQVADKILKKCGGVPLAIITMAGYLVGKSMEEWMDLCTSIGFCGKDKERTGNTEWILSLSYYDLPSHLKTCLLYLSIFPEDYEISKDALIWMWIAEGFVISEQPGAGLFEIGEGYFNELINRSLIQPVEGEYTMIIDGCRVHDMIHDLIRSLSREASFATVLDNGEEVFTGSNTARRLALHNRVVQDTAQDICMDTTRARSFVGFGCKFVPHVQLRSFKLLRMLYLEDCKQVQLDEHIADLHHLRCLGICKGYVGLELPKEIGALRFLQVLYLEKKGLLPSSLGMLTQLVCLHAPWMDMSGGIIKNLTSLQELQIQHPGNDDKSMGQFVKDLCNLSELRVLRVSIENMNERMRLDLFTSAGNLHRLQYLAMVGRFTTGDQAACNHGLPACIDPAHLPNLTLLFLGLRSLDDNGLKMLGALPVLCHLFLRTTYGRAMLTGTAARVYFQKLQSLLLWDSTLQLVVNEESSSVSLTIWDRTRDAAPAFGPKRKQDSCCKVARAVMPNLGALSFAVDVVELRAYKNGSCDNLGLEYLTSLQKITVGCYGGWFSDVEEAALRHAMQAHPNRPTLQLERRF